MKFLDLFCGAGGAAVGYHQAGFQVTGVDLVPQKHYPFEFIQADALEFLDDGGWKDFDAIHASPPCQFASRMRNLPWLKGKDYPALIKPTRDRLIATGLPWVIENVYSARWGSKQLAKFSLQEHGMQAGWLCGAMFGRPFYRHRLFESNFFWLQPGHPKHIHTVRDGRALGGRARDFVFRYRNGAQKRGCGIGHAAGGALVREAMEISWMTRDELTQAIPPVYTKYIGECLKRAMGYTWDAP